MALVRKLTDEIVDELIQTDSSRQTDEYSERLHIAAEILMDILTKDEFVEFVTDYLYKIVAVMSWKWFQRSPCGINSVIVV